MKNKDIKKEISIAAYYNELVRRTQFAGQGKGILVLWREIAWKGTAPKKNFKLKAEDIINAEKTILRKINSLYL